MNLEEENQYIQQVLPIMANKPNGLYLGEEDYAIPKNGVDTGDYIGIARRLVNEGLATTNGAALYLAITTKGKQIAERPNGYLGYLREQEKRLHTEESRAKKNVAGTFGSFIVAGLALLFTLCTYFATNQDTSALEKKVQALELRLKALEQHR